MNESDYTDGSLFGTSPSSRGRGGQTSQHPLETQHASLRRKKSEAPMPPLYSPILEKIEVISN